MRTYHLTKNNVYTIRQHPTHGWWAEVRSAKKFTFIKARKHMANNELAEAACRHFMSFYDGILNTIIEKHPDDGDYCWTSNGIRKRKEGKTDEAITGS